MSAPRPATPRRRLASPWLVLPLVLAAAWVNAPHLARLLHKTGLLAGSDGSVPAAADPPATSQGEPPAPAPLAETAATFVPYDGEGQLADPFAHETASSAEPASPDAAPGQALPEVSLVLCSAHGSRACVDGEVVARGAELRLGVVEEILPDGVVVKTKQGERITLRLPAIDARERERARAAAPPDAKAPPDAAGAPAPTPLDLLRTLLERPPPPATGSSGGKP